MEAAGYEFAIAPVDLDAAPPETTNAAGRRLFDMEIAVRYGYHPADSDRIDKRRAQEIVDRERSAEETAELDNCLEVALRELQAPGPSLSDWLGFTIDVTEDHELLDRIEEWRSCLESRQPGRVADWPGDMPTERDALSFDLAHATDWSAAEPTDDEIELAVDDATCRERTGFTEEYYQTEWDAQVVLLRDNLERLEAERDVNERYRDRVMEVIAEHAE